MSATARRQDVGLSDVPVDRVTRLCAENVAPVMDAAAVVLVFRLTIGPHRTIEVILSPDEADLLGRDLRANALYLASRDSSVETSRSDRR
ncbi:hypothetical protein ACQPX6_12130 [Actinomycetospora sp. CA-101289]|uniref:hypothetical protein n=1 Tax=Actinomycetospora sp. CA-101289 TaxID=3239893 RepID=UPI003D97EED9